MTIPDGLSERNITHNIEQVEGGRKFSFALSGEPCKVALHENPSAMRVAAYQAILTDVYKIRAFLRFACNILEKRHSGIGINKFDSNDDDHLTCSSLYHSSVSLYGKCFTTANGRKVKLEEAALKKRLSAAQIEVHDRFNSLRDNWTAHGGVSDHETNIPVVLFTEKSAIPVYIATSTAVVSPAEMEDLLSLCEPMIDLINSLIEKQENKLFKDDPAATLRPLREKAEDFIILPFV